MDQTFWSEDNMEILISGNRKEVANCGWREGSSTLSTQEAVIFKRGIEKFQKRCRPSVWTTRNNIIKERTFFILTLS